MTDGQQGGYRYVKLSDGTRTMLSGGRMNYGM